VFQKCSSPITTKFARSLLLTSSTFRGDGIDNGDIVVAENLKYTVWHSMPAGDGGAKPRTCSARATIVGPMCIEYLALHEIDHQLGILQSSQQSQRQLPEDAQVGT
jgi:hypothetical protein